MYITATILYDYYYSTESILYIFVMLLIDFGQEYNFYIISIIYDNFMPQYISDCVDVIT